MSNHGPDFIGIGMERAGTSWLFTQISSHPDIWVPPLKELHFFDVIDPKAKYLTHRYSYHLKSRLKQKAAPFMSTAHRPEFSKNNYLTYLLWDLFYFTGKFNVEWYKRLFHKRFTGGRVSGEITPAYSNLTPETIQMILDMNPQMKFVLMVRHPVERLWSGVVHHFRHVKKMNFLKVSEDDMIAYLQESAAQNRSDLLSILKTWQGHVPKEQLFVRAFEEIKNNPEKLIQETYEFLGVDKDVLPPEDLYKKKINSYTQEKISPPPRVEALMAEMSNPVMKSLSKDYPEIVQNW